MDEENGLGMLGGRGCEDGEVTVWMKAADDDCTGWPIDAQTCGAEGDAAVWIDAGVGALTPEVRPPWAGWSGPQSGAFFAECELPCGVRSGADLAMFFLFVAMQPQLVEQGVGRVEGGDGLGGEDRGQALLPEVVEAFDFALGLRRGGVAQGDFVEAHGGTELGKGIGRMGEEKGVVIDIEGEGQAAGGKGAGEEVEMRQQGQSAGRDGPEARRGCDHR